MGEYVSYDGACRLCQSEESRKYRAHLEMVRKTKSCYAPMYLEILDMERTLFEKNFQQGMALARKVADKYGDKHPYLYRQFFFIHLIIAGFLTIL